MAKPTSSTAYRKVDVEFLDGYNPDDDATLVDDGVSGPNEGEVSGLLGQGRNVDALRNVLSNAPVTTKNQAIKDKALGLCLRVMLSFKSSEIEGAIKTLDQPQLDMLMKYIYRGFERPSEGSSAQLLTWHEKVFSVGGQGCIVRVLTDRKRV